LEWTRRDLVVRSFHVIFSQPTERTKEKLGVFTAPDGIQSENLPNKYQEGFSLGQIFRIFFGIDSEGMFALDIYFWSSIMEFLELE
jgi:hypothetical protein